MGIYHFIPGPAGCGKSTWIYETLTRRTLEEPQKKFFLFVPEQNTLKAQQELVRHSGVHGMLTLDVLSFSQLSWRVMEELGITAPDVLDEITKSLLLRRALMNVQDRLQVYGNRISGNGFVARLKSAFSEFAQYGIREEALAAAAEQASTPLLRGKLSDLALIIGEFRALAAGGEKRHVAAEEVPELLLKNLPASSLLKDAVLVFDGFTGFTPVQLAIIERMAEQASELYFAVTVPPELLHAGREHYTDLFWLSRETVKKVTDACTRAGIRQGQEILLREREPERKALSGSLTVRNSVRTRVCGFEDPTEEIRFVAADLRSRAAGSGRRYRRTALAVSDLPAYREILRREFSAAGIPFFIDDRAGAEGSPVVELLRSALLVIRDNYEYEDVLTYLKNPLISSGDREILDRFDNFVRAVGLHGKKGYRESFAQRSFIPDSALDFLPELDRFRETALGPVFVLQEALKEAGTIGGKAAAVLEFAESLGLEDRELQPDDRRFLELSRELLERLSSLFPGENMPVRDFADLVEAGFSDMKAGVIPATVDMVTVGDLKRSRFDDIDSLYLVGANDGKIPQTVSGSGIFTDRERRELTAKNLELAPDDRHDASIQNFYLYLYVNKPAEELTVTFSCLGRDGSRQKPSVILSGAEILYPEVLPAGKAALLEQFSALLTEAVSGDPENCPGKDRLLASWSVLREDPETAPAAGRILKAALGTHGEELLTPETAERLYGETLTGSVTRLEEFEDCPFRHFLDYGLRLRERETFDIESSDIGSLYHRVLDGVLRELRAAGETLGTAPEEELEKLAREKTEEALAAGSSALQETARNRYIAEQVLRITEKTLRVLAEQYRAGEFVTAATERRFLLREEGMQLSGSIDRLDLCEKDGKTYVKIIDYKSGSTEFSLGKAWEGTQLQLAAYMREALAEAESRGKTAVPAGMFLYHIQDPIAKSTEPEENSEAFRMDGLCLDDPEILVKLDRSLETEESSAVIPVRFSRGKLSASSSAVPEEVFRALLDRNREIMRRDAARIRSGEITVRPSSDGSRTGCEYCGCRCICGFDRRIPGYQYQLRKPLNKSVITEKLKNNE